LGHVFFSFSLAHASFAIPRTAPGRGFAANFVNDVSRLFSGRFCELDIKACLLGVNAESFPNRTKKCLLNKKVDAPQVHPVCNSLPSFFKGRLTIEEREACSQGASDYSRDKTTTELPK